MRALLAFDKFKDALTAQQACDITATALREKHPDWTLDLCPLADGGEGFAEILTHSVRGELITVPVQGPCGETIPARYGVVAGAKIPRAASVLFGEGKLSGKVAVIELAVITVKANPKSRPRSRSQRMSSPQSSEAHPDTATAVRATERNASVRYEVRMNIS